MLMSLLRGCYVAFMFAIAAVALAFFQAEDNPFVGLAAAGAILALGAVVLFTDLRERDKQIATISAVYMGLLLGLLLGWLFSLALEPLVGSLYTNPDPARVQQVQTICRFAITVMACYVSISTLLQTKDDFRFIIPYVEFSKTTQGQQAANPGHQCDHRRPHRRPVRHARHRQQAHRPALRTPRATGYCGQQRQAQAQPGPARFRHF